MKASMMLRLPFTNARQFQELISRKMSIEFINPRAKPTTYSISIAVDPGREGNDFSRTSETAVSPTIRWV